MNEIFVEKFGGASVNSAEAIKNVVSILIAEKKKRLIVVSAMGKTTNHLESIINHFFNHLKIDYVLVEQSKNYHKAIIKDLFSDKNSTLDDFLFLTYNSIIDKLLVSEKKPYNEVYDEVVSFGELIATKIISTYFESVGLKHKLLSACEVISTDSNFRNANVDWQITKYKIEKGIKKEFLTEDLILTQGFIASNKEGRRTTLGREGSDFSAAIFAYCLDAKSLTIWKDVAGLLNADPKHFGNTEKFEQVPFSEAIELSYYGASIIHPKTIKPLENKSIPLFVKSFISPKEEGTKIDCCSDTKPQIPSYIFKDKQILLSISPKDFSFIAEANLSYIFSVFAQYGIKINLMQNSAISYSVCFDNIEDKILQELILQLSLSYLIKYNKDLRLITIRRYNEEAINNLIQSQEIIIEQRSRLTAQFLVKV